MSKMIYGVLDKPPFGKMMLFSAQMVLSVFVATVLIANICGVAVSGALVGAGLSTLIYLMITRYESPMFISNSGAFVTPVITALAIGGYTAVALGGLVTAIVYCIFGIVFSKVPVEKVYKVFPKALIGAVTVVIGINLMSFIPTYVQLNGNTSMWAVSVALVTMVSIAVISNYAKGAMKVLPFIGGVIIGYAYASLLTLTNIAHIIDFSIFKDIGFIARPDYAFNHITKISTSGLLSVVLMYIAYSVSAMMECLSDHAALGGIIGEDLYKKPGLSKIFIGEGIANITGTLIGGLGTCSYGESVACIGFSKVSSTIVTLVAAVIMILLGFLTPVQVAIASIPGCVFAGAAMILYGYIACSGIRMLQGVDLNIQKNLVITSVVLSIGVCGLVVGFGSLSFSGTALALIVGVILNIVLKERENV